jgi:hypothetical protein
MKKLTFAGFLRRDGTRALPMSIRRLIFTTFAAMFLTSCAATLPKETVNLSVLLETQIDALEKAHISLINAYFEEKILQAKAIVYNKMYPEWLDDFFAKDVVKKEWSKAVAGDSAQRMESFKAIVEITQKEYNKLLQSAVEPIGQQRTETLTLIHVEYQKARNMVRTIRENMSSVREVQEARERLTPQEIKDAESALYQHIQNADAIIEKMRDTKTQIETIGTRKGD